MQKQTVCGSVKVLESSFFHFWIILLLMRMMEIQNRGLTWLVFRVLAVDPSVVRLQREEWEEQASAPAISFSIHANFLSGVADRSVWAAFESRGESESEQKQETGGKGETREQVKEWKWKRQTRNQKGWEWARSVEWRSPITARCITVEPLLGLFNVRLESFLLYLYIWRIYAEKWGDSSTRK